VVERQYPTWNWCDGEELRIAKKLEKRYPEEIFNYYLSGLGNLTISATRKARVMAKVGHMLVEVLVDEARLIRYAEKIKKDNAKRPALQEDFASVVPGWSELK
jgi:hypothetical protein